jgi:hypothetical protein
MQLHNNSNQEELHPVLTLIFLFITLTSNFADKIIRFDAAILLPILHALGWVTSAIIIDSYMFEKWMGKTVSAILKRIIVWCKNIIFFCKNKLRSLKAGKNKIK